MIALLNILVLLVLLWWKSKNLGTNNLVYYWSGLGLKVLGGISLGLVYKYYFGGGDTWTFFEVSLKMKQLFFNDFEQYVRTIWSADNQILGAYEHQPRAVFFIKLISPLSILTAGNYWTMTLWFSVISFVSCWYLFQQLSRLYQSQLVWYIALFFFPSLTFWTSGLLKDTIAFAALAFLVGYYFKCKSSQFKMSYDLFLSVLAIVVLIMVKYYVAAVFLPLFITLMVSQLLSRSSAWLKMNRIKKAVFLLVPLVMLILITSNSHPNLSYKNLARRIVITHDQFLEKTSSTYRIEYSDLKPTVGSLLLNTPKALFSGLFRPLPWEGHNLLQVIAGTERLIILAMVIISGLAYYRRRIPLRYEATAVMVYSVGLSVVIALSTPNFGTLIRYQAVYHPFVLMLALYALSQSKITGGHLQK